MYRHSKTTRFLIPAVASLLSLAIGTSAMAEKREPRGAISEQENSASTDDNSQDNRPRHRGEQSVAPQNVEQQPVRSRNNQRNENQRNNAQAELARPENARGDFRQRDQENRNNGQDERNAEVQRMIALRNNADNARQNRGNQNERPDFRDNNLNDDRNGRNDRTPDDRSARNDNDRQQGGRQNHGNYGSPENPIAYKPTRPEQGRGQWQEQQQHQANDYRRNWDNRSSMAYLYNQHLRDQHRNEQYRSQQRYYERMNQQHRYYDNDRNNYFNINYYNSPNIYRYYRGGNYYYANRYQADLMRQAINYGYEEGFYAGRADRMDRWGYNYRDAYAYQDANYGYYGYYVDQGTYNYYFREGFRRGYDDGYYSRYQYGHRYNNGYSANDSLLRIILNFTNWH